MATNPEVFDFDIGDVTGKKGDTGNGIRSIALLSTSGLVKTYRITMTNDTTFDFRVSDGEDGNGISGASFDSQTNALTITFDDGSTFTTPSLKGVQGDPGDDGYSPAVTIATITGGHRVTITDKTHPTGQSFDVLDGASDAGAVTYNRETAYNDGTVGKAVSELSRQLSDNAENILAISNNAYTGIENNDKVYGLSDFESGIYVNLNGEVVERVNLYTTGFIPFHKGISSIITNLGTWSNMYEISFWDVGQNFISGISLPTGNVDYELNLANVPPETAFVRFCTFQGQKNTISITQFEKIRNVYDSISDLGIGALITHNDVGHMYIDDGSGSLKQLSGGENTGLVDIYSYQKIYVSKSWSGRGISYGYFVAADGLTILYTIPSSDPLRSSPSAYRVELTVPQNAKYVILNGDVNVVESIKIEVNITEKATDLVFKLREMNSALLAVLADVVYTTNTAQTEYAALQSAMERI